MVDGDRPLILLSVDTSSPQGSIALIKKSSSCSLPTVLFEKSWLKERSHSEVITTITQTALASQDLKLSDLTALAVGIGPGSFTGVRVAINFVRTLAYSLSLPVITANSLLILAEPYLKPDEQPVLCMVNAYKNLIYTASFRRQINGTILTEIKPQALSAKEVESQINQSHICVGDGWSVFENQFSVKFKNSLLLPDKASPYPHAKSLADLSLDPGFSAQTIDWSQVKPLYIRASEAEEKLKVGLLKPLPQI